MKEEPETVHDLENQLLRSGTAPLSHHEEAQAAESPADFIHKLRLSLNEAAQLIRIFVTSINTAQKRRNQTSSPFDVRRLTFDVRCSPSVQ